MIKRITLLAGMLLLLASTPLSAQRWRDMWEQSDQYSLQEVKAAFEAYYKTNKPRQGDGYKQFLRYLDEVTPRLDAQGQVPDLHARARAARLEVEKALPTSQQRTTIDGNWYYIGSSYGYEADGDINGIGRVTVAAFHPSNANIIYVGTPAAGIWKTTNHGTTWTPMTSNEPFWGVCALAIDPTNGNKLYAISGDDYTGHSKSSGVFKTTDAGATWTDISPSLSYTSSTYRARKILVDPSATSTLYAAIYNSGLHKSTDAGSTWTKIYSNTNLNDLEFHPTNSSILYAADDTDVYRSTDAGATWTSTYTFVGTDAIRIAVTAAAPNYVYAVGGGSSAAGTFPGLIRSTTSGLTWTVRSTTPNIHGSSSAGTDSGTSSWWSLGLSVDPNNASRIHCGSLKEWYSADGGVTWTWRGQMDASGDAVHADCHYLAHNNGNIYYCNDGGIYYSTDNGVNWIDLSNGLGITELYRLASSDDDPCLVVMGAQDNGTNLIDGPFPDEVMDQINGGDGMDCLIDPYDAETLYVSSQNGSLRYSHDRGVTKTNITPATLGSGAWVTPYELNPKKSKTLIAGYEDVGVIYGAGTGSWVNLSSGALGTSTCLSVTFAPSDTTKIYVSKGSAVYRTTNYGSTWTNITTGLPSGTYTQIVVDPTNSSNVFVSISNWTADKKIYESTDGGSTWTNISGTGELPNAPANCLIYQKGTADGIYLGTEAGVYYKDDGLGTWQYFSDGLPYVSIRDLQIVTPTKKLRAATHGRSAWETNLYGITRAASLSLSGAISTDNDYEAYGVITTTQVISSPGDITCTSATGVSMQAGFRVNAGATFLGIVEVCMDIPVSENLAPIYAGPDPDPVPPLPTAAKPVAYSSALFPNPGDNQVTLRVAMPESGLCQVELFDLSMRRIAILDYQVRESGTHDIRLETQEWPAGTYLIRAQYGPQTETRKLVVQH